jgi:hypothetical protein
MSSFIFDAMRNDALRHRQELPFDPSSFFMTIGVVITIIAVLTGIPAIMASTRLNQKRGRTFIIVAAGINCLTGILGILLCIFTVIELNKPDVKEVFAANELD